MEKLLFEVINNEQSEKFISPSNMSPRYLYKYYSNIKYATDAIRNNRIHFEHLTDYNDFHLSSC